MNRVATIVLGALLMLTAGALGVVGTALVLLLVMGRGGLFAPAGPQESQAAVPVPVVSPIAAPPPALLPPPAQAEEPGQVFEKFHRDEAVSPVAFAMSPVTPGMLVPLASDADVTVKIIGAWNANDSTNVKFTHPDDATIVRIDVTLKDSDVNLPPITATFVQDGTWQLTVDRPGTYSVAAYYKTDNGPVQATVIPQEPTLPYSGSSDTKVTANHFGFVVGGQSLLTKVNPLSQYLMPRNVTGVNVSVISTATTKLAVWSTEAGDGSRPIELNKVDVTANGSHSVSIPTAKFTAGKAYDLQLVDIWSQSPKKYPIGRLVIPASNADSPVVIESSNHAHVDLAAFSDAEQKIANGYLRLRGSGLASSASLRFPTFVKNGDTWGQGDCV